MARVTVPLAALERQMSCGQQLAQAVVKVLGMTTARPVAIEGHAWRLGQYQGIKHKAELTLLLDTVPRLAIAGHTVPMAEVLGFKGGAVTVDQPALRKLVDNPTGTAGDGQETPSERAARIRKRVAELKASGARDSRKRVAQEEGIDVSRVGQILRAHPEPKATSNWFPDTALTKLPPPAKKRKA